MSDLCTGHWYMKGSISSSALDNGTVITPCAHLTMANIWLYTQNTYKADLS